MNEQITDCNRAVEQDGSGDALALVYPVLPYKEALDVQHNVVCALKENRIKTDIVLFMEHLPVYTLGKRGGRDYLHVSDVWLKDHGIDVVQTGRGGSITWHGPGQLVVYPIMNLKKAGLGAAEYVHKLETIMIHVAGQLGINASRRESGRGVWVGNKKLGSVGVAISRNISFHGLALNVNNSFGFFKKINPCGLHDIEMTSLEKEGVYGISVRSIRQTVMESIEKFFGIKLKRVSPDSFPDTIGCSSRRLSRQNGVRKPGWLKRSISSGRGYGKTRNQIRQNHLNTVCIEARCPNRFECFTEKTATFLILGDTCTRNCSFCNIGNSIPARPDPDEPGRIAETTQSMGIRYVVITSVTRDDLEDGGANHFVLTVKSLRKFNPDILIELLIPDFKGLEKSLRLIADSDVDVIGHNIETVERLYPSVRPEGMYSRSLKVISFFSGTMMIPGVKTGLMLGIGETGIEIEKTLSDIFNSGCRSITVGQYLQPSKYHTPVHRYVLPSEFEFWKKYCLDMGFENVNAGPLVRSSYKAHSMFLSK